MSYKIHEESVAILGHNGAGKSTTFGLLSAQLHPHLGELFLEGKTKAKYQNVLNSAGVCFQEDRLWGFMTTSKIMSVF